MKTIKRLFVLFIISLAIALVYYFTADDVVVSSWSTKVGEVIAVTVPVFILISLLYFVNRAMVRSVKGMAKKSPPKKEGQDTV
ncbi:hypothetical protein FMM05_19240 [Flavobacterium zepuense]|uniref:Uncharacterized protein n=1 Tax=Flavobacterium zepuense TaxID=2593302 RepID=A0A552UV19_9FLAO|nr:hypothetical protein [Flavobacterium zepuense]TRW22084.1 hypothetical protein FMM05_19240 [Flavobacterium zepuense]